MFWIKIKDLLVSSFSEAFQYGQLSISQRRGVITLIHKGKQLAKDEIGNWRPISLTNTDYKILAKALSLCMQGVVKDVINEDQVGYIKGRNISTIIRVIDDTLEFVLYNNINEAILALDYSKSFDPINKSFLLAAFEKFGFGHDFQNWIKVLTSSTESFINYCGWLTEFFPVNSGIRQGCPFSPLAFVLGIELFAIKIRESDDIKGIKLPFGQTNQTIKIKQYADDNTLVLADVNDIRNALEVARCFAVFSGLNLNLNKTEGMWIGASRNSRERVDNIKRNLGESQIKILGTYFNNFICASNLELNWKGKIDNICRQIKIWEARNLSLIGKVQIIKTFLLSQLVYTMQALVMPEDIQKEVNTILCKFLWKKRFNNCRAFAKIKRDIVCQEFELGGIKMINIKDIQTSFQIKWFKKLFQEGDSIVCNIPLYYYEKLGRNLSVLQSNVPARSFKGLSDIKSVYWQNSLSKWLDINYLFHSQQAEDNILTNSIFSQVIWNNHNLRYRNEVLLMKKLIACNIIHVGDLFINGVFVSLAQLAQRVGPSAGLVLQHNVLFNALPS